MELSPVLVPEPGVNQEVVITSFQVFMALEPRNAVDPLGPTCQQQGTLTSMFVEDGYFMAISCYFHGSLTHPASYCHGSPTPDIPQQAAERLRWAATT